ncbi:MAG: hypothetical protein FWD22_03230 [Treponema sp.]|nr:hypothetical protein [Treponema sp.]
MLVLSASLVFAFGGREKATALPVVQVTGIVRLVGNEPFTELVIYGHELTAEQTTPAVSWFITRDERNKLFDLQHQIVTVEGEETVTELTFANGMPAGTRRELSNIRILEVH